MLPDESFSAPRHAVTIEVFRPCAVIPVYNHYTVLANTVDALRLGGVPVIMVNDGSNPQCSDVIAEIVAQNDQVYRFDRQHNGGKGAAVKDGLRVALEQHFSHAIQIDADGQHDIGDVKRFLNAARTHPRALVAGYPAYDSSVPRSRYYGRYATLVWVWINTLSTTIRDSMCGFRVYPLGQSYELLKNATMGDRMDFDIEFIVRWLWAGYPLEQLQTRVIYPESGVSHFRLWRDNVLISWMHTRLFFGMLLRLPCLMGRKLTGYRHHS
jgi:glycosyltransferase involved in cell wall biosynthesis